MSQFTYRSSSTVSFVVKNNSKKKIRIFNYPLEPGQQRDLMKIPNIGEEDIRSSLIKGQLQFMVSIGQISIVSSDIDLIQFNTSQQTFLQNAGANVGTATTIQVAPLGNDQDDAVNLSAAYNAGSSTGRPVLLLPGTYLWKSAHQLPATNLTVIACPGVTLQSTLPADGLETNAPFNYNDPNLLAITTLTAQPAKGSTTIAVNDASSNFLAPGTLFRIQAPVAGGLLRLATYRVVSRNIGAKTIVVDRPIARTFPTNSLVNHLVPIQNFRLFGNGMRITGTGDRGIEIVNGWECYISGVTIDGQFQDFVCGYDLGSTRCVFNDIRVNCNNFGFAGIAFENSEDCVLDTAWVQNAAGQGNVYLPGAVNMIVNKVHSTGGTRGILLGVNDVTNTEGCHNTQISNCTFDGSTLDGILIGDGATATSLSNVGCSYNGEAGIRVNVDTNGVAPQGLQASNIIVNGNAAYGILVDSASRDLHITNIYAVDNLESSVRVTGGGSLYISGGLIKDTGVVAAFHALAIASGAFSELRFTDVHIWGSGNQNIQMLQVDTAASSICMNVTVERGSAAGVLFQASGSSSLQLRGTTRSIGGLFGVLLGAATDALNIDGGVDLSSASDYIVLSNGASSTGPLNNCDCLPGISLITLSDANTTLTWIQWHSGVLKFSGTLTGTRKVRIPALKVRQRIVNTTGQTLTIIAHDGLGAEIGTGANVTSGTSADVIFDGTNVITL